MNEISEKLLRPVWLEIDLDALRHNFQETRRLVGPDVEIICALKCNAYGFGSQEVAEEVISMGAYGIGVADLFEAVNLRKKGITAPILLFGNNLPSAAETVLEYDLIPTVTDLKAARAYAEHATSPVNIFVKVDVGLNRIGVLPEKAVAFVEEIASIKHIVVGGMYTHFHFTANDGYVEWQFQKLKTVLDTLEEKGIEIKIKMASATPAILRHPQTYLNAVDPGRLIFGNPAGAQPRQAVDLKPVFRALKAKIIERKTIGPPTEFVGDAIFPIQRDTVVGVIPIGWGDGYSGKHSSLGPALVHGKRVSVLNGVHFEHTRIDLTDVPEAEVGDEVVVSGKQGEEEITLDEIVEIRDSNLSQVCQSVRNHIPWLYFKNGRPYKLKTPLGESMF